jgi:hypothetical protein
MERSSKRRNKPTSENLRGAMSGGPAKRRRTGDGGGTDSATSIRDSARANHANKNVVLSVEAFARRSEGADRAAIEGYRRRREGRRVRTAQQLRSYHKLMKKQGYEPGKGASRKRPREADDGSDTLAVTDFDHDRGDDGNDANGTKRGQEDRTSNNASGNIKPMSVHQMTSMVRCEDGDNDEGGPGPSTSKTTPFQGRDEGGRRRPRKPKSDPNAKSLRRAELRREEREAEQERRREQERIRAQKLRERRHRSIKLGQRTKKGQPIMKNVVHDILRKLEKEQQQQHHHHHSRQSSRQGSGS